MVKAKRLNPTTSAAVRANAIKTFVGLLIAQIAPTKYASVIVNKPNKIKFLGTVLLQL